MGKKEAIIYPAQSAPLKFTEGVDGCKSIIVRLDGTLRIEGDKSEILISGIPFMVEKFY
jgi:hypothetical protein